MLDAASKSKVVVGSFMLVRYQSGAIHLYEVVSRVVERGRLGGTMVEMRNIRSGNESEIDLDNLPEGWTACKSLSRFSMGSFVQDMNQRSAVDEVSESE